MSLRHCIIIIVLFAFANANADSKRLLQKKLPGGDSAFVMRYMDSLRIFREAQNSIQTNVPRTEENIEERILFLPPTFYKKVAHNNFALNTTPSLLDIAFLDLYLNRPDLIESTENQLSREGKSVVASTVKVKHAPEIVDKVAPTPVEPSAENIDLVVWKPNFWKLSSDYYLQFLQNYISSNWYKGGESNYSMVSAITINANFNNKQKVKWDNKLEMKLGFQTSKQDSLHSLRASENLLRLTSKLGLQASKRWYYTAQVVAYTQFLRQWQSNSQIITTDFMGPFNMNVSLGMDYSVDWFKHRLTGSVHLAPAAYNLKFVKRKELATRYGIEEGRRQLHDVGSQMTIDLNWKFSNSVSWKTRIYGYTTYERAEIEWENTFTFQFNKWISSKIFVFPRFDDGARRDESHGYWQLKEYASLGFSYSI